MAATESKAERLLIQFTFKEISILCGIVYAVYLIYLILYRLVFSPLAKFPGPKLAALTYWVEAYYELWKGEGGQFPFEYQKWHSKYGPIIRINPDELHVQDSSYHEYFYHPSRPVSKPERIANRFGNPLSAFAAVDHAKHRQRRAALNPFFSKSKIQEYAPHIQMYMDKLCTRLENDYKNTGKVVSLNRMWGCLSSDTIVGYSFEKEYGFVDKVEFFSPLNQAMIDLLEPVHYSVMFPWINKIMEALPESWVIKLAPEMKSVFEFNHELFDQIDIILKQKGQNEKSRTSLFSALLESDLPPEELTPLRIQHESISIIGAGVESTMRTLVVACFHILDQPLIEARLRAELLEAIPDINNFPSWDALSKLPFLKACIEEALRLSYGTSQRMPRAYPDGTLEYKDWTIPKGTMVSMDNYAVSHDEAIFPHSHKFVPERWLNDPVAPDGKRLQRYMVSFGKGTRSCTGMQLGYAELYIGLANFFRRVEGVKLYDTDLRDVELARDRFAPKMYKGSQGVRATIG